MQFIFENDVDDVVLVRPSTMNPSHLCMGRDLMNDVSTGSWGERYDCISNQPLLLVLPSSHLSFSWNLLAAFFISLGP